jgi:hypothetical protein
MKSLLLILMLILNCCVIESNNSNRNGVIKPMSEVQDTSNTIKYFYADSLIKVEVSVRKISSAVINFKITSADKKTNVVSTIHQGEAILDSDGPQGFEDEDLHTTFGWLRYRYTNNGCNGVILINCSNVREYKIEKEERLMLDNDCNNITKHTLKKIR